MDFWTINAQAMLFGWLNLPFAVGALFAGLAALWTRRGNHIYTGITITCFLAVGFHVAQFLFALLPTEHPHFPYIQFGRTVLFVLAGLSAARVIYYIFRSPE
jgi:hypothetical protein